VPNSVDDKQPNDKGLPVESDKVVKLEQESIYQPSLPKHSNIPLDPNLPPKNVSTIHKKV